LFFILSILSLYASIIIGKLVVKNNFLNSCRSKTFSILILSINAFKAVIF